MPYFTLLIIYSLFFPMLLSPPKETIWTPLTTSISKDSSPNISLSMQNLLDTMTMPRIPKKAILISMTDTNVLYGDQSYPISFDLKYNNGEFASNGYKLILGLRGPNTAIIKDEEINLDIIDSNTVVHSTPVQNDFTSPSENKSVYCSYKYSDINITDEELRVDMSKVEKIIRIKSTTLILEDSIVKRMVYRNHTVSVEVVKFDDNKNIKNVFGVEMFDSGNEYIAAIANDHSLRIFRVTNNKNFDVMLYKRINSFDYDEIFKFGVLTDNESVFIFSSKNKGFNEIIFDNTSPIESSSTESSHVIITLSTNTNDSNNNIIDFIILKQTIYAISKDNGILIYTFNPPTTTINYSKILFLPYVKSIDYYINPFNGNQYIGVSTSMKRSNEEFFIEFLLYEESYPVVNKIFTSNDTSIATIPHFTLDSFSSVFVSGSQIYLIRRGMLNTVSFVTYTIRINETVSNPKKIFSLSDSDTFYNQISFLFDNKIYIINNIEYPTHVIRCKFDKDGKYSMRFLQNIDSCEINVGTQSRFSPCCKIIDANYIIYGSQNTNAILICSILIGVIFGITILILTCVLCSETHCLKRNKMKIIVIDKNRKDELYEDSSEEEDTDEDEEEHDTMNKEKNSMQVINFYSNASEKPNLHERSQSTYTYNTIDQDNPVSVNSRNKMFEIDKVRKQSTDSFDISKNDISEISKKTTEMPFKSTELMKSKVLQIKKK